MATRLNKNAKMWIESQPHDVQKMIRAMRRQLTLDDLRNVYQYGADRGYRGFIAYYDTQQFYKRHADAVWQLLDDAADESGTPIPQMIVQLDFCRDGNGTSRALFEHALVLFALGAVAFALIAD